MTYFSTFISGFNELVETALRNQIADVETALLLDGLIVYETAALPEEIRKIRFFNNSFILLVQYEFPLNTPLDEIAKHILKDFDFEQINQHLSSKAKTFKIIFSDKNVHSAINNSIRSHLEQWIIQFTRLSLQPNEPNLELWLISRREGNVLWGIRVTKPIAEEQKVPQGQLKPPLAHLLCLLSEPRSDDTFLDTFCGYGAIPIERAKSFPYQHIYAGDNKSGYINYWPQGGKKATSISFHIWNALKLETIPDSSIDKIVTDPPWGKFEFRESIDLEVFYQQMLTEFHRVLKAGGLAVILIGAKEEFASAIGKFSSQFEILKKYDILVSGKKASIYKLKKFR